MAKRDYLFDLCPRWLKYSGLPGQFNRTYGPTAWGLFKELAELDCRFNPNEPGWVVFSQEELARVTGLSKLTVHRQLTAFASDKWIRYKAGSYRGQKGAFAICCPIRTPVSIQNIARSDGGDRASRDQRRTLRYAEGQPLQQTALKTAYHGDSLSLGEHIAVKGVSLPPRQASPLQNRGEVKRSSTREVRTTKDRSSKDNGLAVPQAETAAAIREAIRGATKRIEDEPARA